MTESQEFSRKIIISEPITDSLAGEIVSHIIAINDYDEQMASVLKEYEPQPIEMFINSGGGSATAGNAIIGAMEMSNTAIITYGIGVVASMALAIFVSGDIRIAHRFVRMMYHSVAYGADGHIKDHEDAIKEANTLQEMYDSLFLSRTKLTSELMASIRQEKKDFFFSAKKALKLGIADDVITLPEKKYEIITEEESEELKKELNN